MGKLQQDLLAQARYRHAQYYLQQLRIAAKLYTAGGEFVHQVNAGRPRGGAP
ncbi:MAG: hypothetical protein ACOCXZ_02470 [Chloroflexota bacterium]